MVADTTGAARQSPPCPLNGCKGTRWHADVTDIEYFTPDLNYAFHECPDCGILFVSPMLWDRLDQIYPTTYYSYAPSSQGIVQRVKQALDQRVFRKLLNQIPGQELSVLDVGGGSGWLLDQLKACSPRVSFTQCVDLDEAAQAEAVSRGHAYHLGRIEEFQSDRKFDLILALNLIEHVPDPAAVLRQFAGLVSDHGRVLIKTPNYDALDARLFRHHSWAGYHAPRHFVLFNRDSFGRLAEQSGLSVISSAYTQGAPFWSVSVLDMLRRHGLVNLSADRPAIYHPLIPLLQAAFAAIDFARAPFAPLSQMFFTLGPGAGLPGQD